jgi:rhamnose transport system ATP-binding protein
VAEGNSELRTQRPGSSQWLWMSAPWLKLKEVTRSFGAVRALRRVSFDLHAGEVHAVVGENGAGKSTLIKMITGAHQPDGGTIEFNGVAVERLNPASARALGIAAIYQQPALFPDLSVAENIALSLEPPRGLRLVNWAERRVRAMNLLQRVGATFDPEKEARELSMPEQQLVEIARALGAGARVLIMDEPTASLTTQEVDLLLRLVREVRSQGVGIIYISHRLEEIFRVADRVTVLRDGLTVGTRMLPLGSRATDLGQDSRAVTESELIQMMVGREISTIFPPAEGVPGETTLSLQGIGCTAAGLHDINLDVRSGEIVGLAGLVGAGRTELARVIFGITPADSGTLRLGGKPLRIGSPGDAIKAGIAYVPEDRRKHGAILEMAVAANVSLAIHKSIFPGGWLRMEAERNLAEAFIRDLSIKTLSPYSPVSTLSGGNQQKVALARWLAAKPRVLILDEPTQGVDVGAKAEIHKLIRGLAARGLAVLMISSELPEILGMSDRIAIMRGGSLTTVLDSSKADANTVMSAALGQRVNQSPK